MEVIRTARYIYSPLLHVKNYLSNFDLVNWSGVPCSRLSISCWVQQASTVRFIAGNNQSPHISVVICSPATHCWCSFYNWFFVPPQSGLFSTITVRISDHANTVCPGLVSLTSSVDFNPQRGRDWCVTEPCADNKCSALLQWCGLTLWFIVAITFSFTVWVMKLINLILFKENWVWNFSHSVSNDTLVYSFICEESLPLWAFVALPLSW